MITITCRPAERDRFHTSYSKSAGAILTVPDPYDGGELNYMIVTVDGGPVDAFCYLHYSRVLAEHLNTYEFSCNMLPAEIRDCLVAGIAEYTGDDEIAVTAGSEMYDGGRYYRIKITPTDIDISAFMMALEKAVRWARRAKTTVIITYSTQDLLTVLGINDQEKEKDYGMETRK